MKTKVQKKAELKKASDLLDSSKAMVFADFSNIAAEDVRKLRTELKKNNANLLVIKKRLLGIALRERGIDVDLAKNKVSVGTVFSEKGTEPAAASTFKFFQGLEVPEGGDKNMWISHLIGGYDIAGKQPMDAATIIMIGKLPPREVLLAQFLGMISAPIKALLYVLDQKSKQAKPAAEPVTV